MLDHHTPFPRWAPQDEGLSPLHVDRCYHRHIDRLVALSNSASILHSSTNRYDVFYAVQREIEAVRREYEEWRTANGHGPIPAAHGGQANG